MDDALRYIKVMAMVARKKIQGLWVLCAKPTTQRDAEDREKGPCAVFIFLLKKQGCYYS